MLGVGDVRTDKRIDFVGGARGTEALEAAVDSGKAAVAFSMFPVTIDDLMAISDAGDIMPPKSTWFEPKLRDGLLIHLDMKVLVADKFEQSGIDGLTSAGCEVVYEPDLKDDRLTEAIRATSADVLVVRGTKVTAPMLDAGRLSLIVRAGAGYNTIDVAAASTRGIYVSNCPGQERHRGRGACLRADPRARSARARQRRGAARRQVEQEGVLEGAGPVRADARPARARQHRPGNDPARRRLRHERRGLEPALRRGRTGR